MIPVENCVGGVFVKLCVSAMLLSGLIWSPAQARSRSAHRVVESVAVPAGRSYQKKTTQKKASKKPAAPSRENIQEAEQLLSDLGYWTGPIDGVMDAGSRHALIAFQKVEGRNRTGRLTLTELDALRSATRPQAHEAGPFHVEVDLTRQVLFIVDDSGSVSKILPVSTGNDKFFESTVGTQKAVTPRGRFRVYRKIPGWRKSELGLLYYPSYIVGGIAIHGNPSVPAYPASHGCIRIPMHAATEFSDMTPIGTPVIVYENPAVPIEPTTL